MAEKKRRFSRRVNALLWSLAVAVVIFTLIALEQIPILYVIATLSLVVLLITVGFSDLESVGTEGSQGFAVED